MIGLYLHVPFCLKKCHYCNYLITTDRSSVKRQMFFASLQREAEEASRRLGPRTFDSLYLGGGTPSSLDAGEMAELLGFMRRLFAFHPDAEVTCETNPGEVDEEKLTAYRRLGVNRISLGAQTFNDRLLGSLNRIHDAGTIRRTAALLSQAGFVNVSYDLMIRLPDQSLRDVQNALEEALDCGAKQIVIYDLNIHEQTVWGRWVQEKRLVLPTDALHRRMYQAVVRRLTRAGFGQYEVSTFAIPGYESRHNLLYWRNQEYLGLGPGAFSYLNGVRYQFASTIDRYLKKCTDQDWHNDEEDRIDPATRERETLLTGLRLNEGVCLEAFPLIREEVSKTVRRLSKEGLLDQKANRIRLTSKGKRLAESVFAEFA